MDEDEDRLVTQFCGECGHEMLRRPDGAWHDCCNRLGYWADIKPLPRDSWMPVLRLHDWGSMTFYPTEKWPIGRKPVLPRLMA